MSSNSQSPQAKRGTAQDYTAFTKDSVPSETFPAPGQTDEANVGAWKHQGESVSNPDRV
jgi:hypothetical protein